MSGRSRRVLGLLPGGVIAALLLSSAACSPGPEQHPAPSRAQPRPTADTPPKRPPEPDPG